MHEEGAGGQGRQPLALVGDGLQQPVPGFSGCGQLLPLQLPSHFPQVDAQLGQGLQPLLGPLQAALQGCLDLPRPQQDLEGVRGCGRHRARTNQCLQVVGFRQGRIERQHPAE